MSILLLKQVSIIAADDNAVEEDAMKTKASVYK